MQLPEGTLIRVETESEFKEVYKYIRTNCCYTYNWGKYKPVLPLWFTLTNAGNAYNASWQDCSNLEYWESEGNQYDYKKSVPLDVLLHPDKWPEYYI